MTVKNEYLSLSVKARIFTWRTVCTTLAHPQHSIFEMDMIFQFSYRGPRRSTSLYYSGPPWLVLIVVICIALLLTGGFFYREKHQYLCVRGPVQADVVGHYNGQRISRWKAP